MFDASLRKIESPRAPLAAVAVLLVSMAGPACGGEGDSVDAYTVRASTTMSAAAPAITKAQFVARVNRICREAWGVVIDNFRKYSSWQDPDEGMRRRFAGAVQRSLLAGLDFHIFDEIRDTGSPPGQQRQIERIIGPFQLSVELGQMRRPDPDRSTADVVDRFSLYNRRAGRYGLDDCLVDRAHLRSIERLSSTFGGTA